MDPTNQHSNLNGYGYQLPSKEPRGGPLSNGSIKNILGTLILIIAAPLFALFLTAHVFQPYEVDGTSMETTLQNADRLIVSKFQKTLTNMSGTHTTYSRGDIIVFDRPTQLVAPKETSHLIKRVIGLPGERVVVEDGEVTIYNVENPNGFKPDEGQDYSSGITSTPGKVELTVGQNEYFVLGDNRTNSSDSRVFGTVPDSIIVGKAYFRFIPLSNMTKL